MLMQRKSPLSGTEQKVCTIHAGSHEFLWAYTVLCTQKKKKKKKKKKKTLHARFAVGGCLYRYTYTCAGTFSQKWGGGVYPKVGVYPVLYGTSFGYSLNTTLRCYDVQHDPPSWVSALKAEHILTSLVSGRCPSHSHLSPLYIPVWSSPYVASLHTGWRRKWKLGQCDTAMEIKTQQY